MKNTACMVFCLLGLFLSTKDLAADTKPATDESPTKKLSRAEAAYSRYNYREAINILEPIIVERTELFDEDLEKGRNILGACYFLTDQIEKARDQFRYVLIQTKGEAKLDPFYYSQAIIDTFEEIRLELIKNKVIQDTRKTAESDVFYVQIIKERYFILNLLPFGAGQFQNGHTLKGSLFAAFQAITLTVNILSYFYIQSLLDDQNYLVNPVDKGTGEALQVVQYTSFGIFLGLVVWGIIDALVYYEGDEISEPQPMLKLPGEERPRKIPKEGQNSLMDNVRFNLGPTTRDNSWGASFSIEITC